ncbi:unnamed protein product, partial [Rotaria sp. Silwood1]
YCRGDGYACCGSTCCPTGRCCNGVCCAAGESCCGGYCCAAGRTCCGTTCCLSGVSNCVGGGTTCGCSSSGAACNGPADCCYNPSAYIGPGNPINPGPNFRLCNTGANSTSVLCGVNTACIIADSSHPTPDPNFTFPTGNATGLQGYCTYACTGGTCRQP